MRDKLLLPGNKFKDTATKRFQCREQIVQIDETVSHTKDGRNEKRYEINVKPKRWPLIHRPNAEYSQKYPSRSKEIHFR